MARRPNPQRKQDLLEGIVAYLAMNGLGELSLRPLAQALGTSTYTLTYQFGSKEELIVDTLDYVKAQHDEALRVAFAEEDKPGAAFRRYWSWLADDENSRVVRITLEATTLGMAQTPGYAGFRRALVDRWREEWVRHYRVHSVDPESFEARATLIAAGLLGLTFDLLATGDRDRLEAAAEEFIKMLDDRLVKA